MSLFIFALLNCFNAWNLQTWKSVEYSIYARFSTFLNAFTRAFITLNQCPIDPVIPLCTQKRGLIPTHRINTAFARFKTLFSYHFSLVWTSVLVFSIFLSETWNFSFYKTAVSPVFSRFPTISRCVFFDLFFLRLFCQ